MHMCVQVTAREAVLVATAQPITKDVADSLAHTAAIHSKSFAKRRHDLSPFCADKCNQVQCIPSASEEREAGVTHSPVFCPISWNMCPASTWCSPIGSQKQHLIGICMVAIGKHAVRKHAVMVTFMIESQAHTMHVCIHRDVQQV